MSTKSFLLASVSAIAIVVATPVDARKPEHNNDRVPPPPAPVVDQVDCLSQGDDLFLNPFNAESAHHRPIGKGAQFADDSDPMTVQLKKAGFNTINSPASNGYGFSIYQAKDGDPTVTVTNDGTKNGLGLPVTIKAPQNLAAPSGGEGVVVIYDSTTGIGHEFLHWQSNGTGGATASIHHEWDIKDKGHTQPGGDRIGLSASGVAGMFGILRGFEANTSGCKIQHAIQITLSLKGQCGSMVSKETVGPASSTDSSCNEGACQGSIPYGALLAIPPESSVPLDTLGLSEPGMRLAEALQKYGTYVVDTSGGCPSIRGDQDISKEVQQQLSADMHKLFPLLRVVTNNDISEPTAGGGAPCAENAAFDAQEADATVLTCDGTDTVSPDQVPGVPPPTLPPGSPPHEPVPPPEIVDMPHDPVVAPPDEDHKPVPPPEIVDVPPPDDTQNWQQLAAQWLWEHLPKTSEGLQLFRDWITEFVK